jgi:RND family efflux transporter MFP subunit
MVGYLLEGLIFMFKRHFWRGMVLSAACLAGGSALMAADTPASERDTLPAGPRGHTFASERRELSLKIMDLVKEVTVKPGDLIKKGQLLIQQDDTEEQLRWKTLKLIADSEVAEKAADVQWKQAIVTRTRFEGMFKEGVASREEMDKAILDAELGDYQYQKAQLERQQAQLQADTQAEIIRAMKMVSPIDGVVEAIDIEAGEVIDPQKPAMAVVTLDPLHVEVPVPSNQALQLKVGQKLKVAYENKSLPAGEAEIIYLAPVVDRKSDNQLVRLRMPNPELRPAGLAVYLLLPERQTQAEAAPNR